MSFSLIDRDNKQPMSFMIIAEVKKKNTVILDTTK